MIKKNQKKVKKKRIEKMLLGIKMTVMENIFKASC